MKKIIKKRNDNADNLIDYANEPLSNIKWVPIEKVYPNDYNPNTVAPNELRLLYVSVTNDGYTQPVVTSYVEDEDKYMIVDGFHRYYLMKTFRDIYDRYKGRLPVVVLRKASKADYMASTVRHNRARGKHSIRGMSSLVFDMIENGYNDAEICSELGMEADELIRLKHITGIAKLFESVEYNKAWETKRQIMLRREYERRTQGQ